MHAVCLVIFLIVPRNISLFCDGFEQILSKDTCGYCAVKLVSPSSSLKHVVV